MIDRRRVLTALASLGLVPSRALAFGEPALVDIAELDLGAGTLSRPNAWKRLLYEVIQTTSVECAARAVQVEPDEPTLFQHPFLVLVGADTFDKVESEGLEQLQRFLQYGGFLLIDDTTGADKGGFDTSARRLVSRLFPTRPLSPLPSDHSIYRTFFLLDRPLGRLDRHRFLEGVTVGNLSPVIYCRNDLSGALDRGLDGRPIHSCVPGGELQRREAVKLAINLLMYSLTANYKKDQAHVRQLMKEGRLE
ncbi:MAG: DUF4159 domain-containing protein [Myxococcota bacterium]